MEIESINYQDVAEPDQMVSGAGGTGQKNTRKSNAKTKKQKPPRLVERATALRGLSIGISCERKSTVRRRTEQDLSDNNPEVPYVKTERAIRDLVCSLMERQDRMNEAIFLKINDLGYRLDNVEVDVEDLQERGRQTTTGRDVPLFIVPHVVMRGIRNYGAEEEWVMVKKRAHHFYTVSIRTRRIRREFRNARPAKAPARAPGVKA